MLKRTVLALMLISAVCLTLTAAEKYAILIAGDYTAANVPADKKWNDGLGNNTEFWNDLYLQWEMLYQKGYKKENIKVLFAHGTDLWNVDNYDYIDTRYRAEHITYDPTERIVNYPITTTGLDNAISGLTITSNDFLYVWAMSHGGSSTQSGIGFIGTGTQPLFYEMLPSEFAGKINAIPAFKKEIVLSLNYAQGFKNVFTGTNVRVELSSTNSKAHRADDKTKIDTYYPYLENELINGNIYYHGEFNFHKYCSLMGQTQYGSSIYPSDDTSGPYPNPFNIDIASTDANNDGQYNFTESYNWIATHQSDLLNSTYTDFKDNGEVTPYYTFPMGNYSSLDYPTLVYNSFASVMEYFAYQYPTKKGIVGITEDLNIANEYFDVSLGLSPNSLTTILDDHSINVNNGAYKAAISMGSGSILKGANNNLINLNGGYFSLDRALVKDVTIGNNYGGSIFVENSSEFNNVSTTLFGSSIDFDYPTGIKEITELEEFTLSNYSDLFIEYGTIQGSYLYPDPNIVNIIDGSVLTVGVEATFNRINLNIEDWGIFNYSNNCIFNESVINVSNAGRLNFPAGSTYTPATNINAGLGAQIIVEENSTLNLNTGILNMQAGAIMTLSKGASLKPAAGNTFTCPRSTTLNLGDESKLYGAIDFLAGSSCKTGWNSTVHIMPGADIVMTETNLVLNYGCDLIVEAGAKLSLVGPMKVVMCPGSEIIVYGEFSAPPPGVVYTTNVDEVDPNKIDLEPWSGIVANVGSIINISGATFENASLPVSGTPASISITGCTFTDCTNGINLVNCNSYTIEGNTFLT